jgi:hypothetical protein
MADLPQRASTNLLESSPIATIDLDKKPGFLQALPDELLLKICQEVVGTDNKRDATSLARMARACRILNDVATAILYRDIHRVREPTNPTGYFSELATFRKDAYLLATLHNNKALGPIIRTMELAPPEFFLRFVKCKQRHSSLLDCQVAQGY